MTRKRQRKESNSLAEWKLVRSNEEVQGSSDENSQEPRESSVESPCLNENNYKNQLQEYTQKARIGFPEYSTIRVGGPPHAPLYKAHVSVNGQCYESPNAYLRTKDAEKAAAKIAVEALLPSKPKEESSYKSLLQDRQCYESPNACLRTKDAEKAAAKKEESSYKSLLQDRQCYESPNACLRTKDAEKAAAKIDLEALLPSKPKEESSYKSLLQDLALSMGKSIPTYETIRFGPPHMHVFITCVEIGNTRLYGYEANTKKAAEINAVKIAHAALTREAKWWEVTGNNDI